MIRKLDRWVWVGGAILAANGGIVNAVGLCCFARQTVSHVTGTTTLFAIALARHDGGELARLGAILGSFVAGAMLAGFIVRNGALKLGRRYAAALWLECLLLLAASLVIQRAPFWGLDFAAAACGLQNAMASTYSGAALRTTHMTGIVTDLGAALGHFLRGIEVDWLRVRFYLTLLGSFMGGAAIGSALFAAVSYKTLYFPVAVTAILAAAYSFYLQPRRNLAPVDS